MASNKAVKNRIKSIKNTKKITKAMELVSASKMKKSVSQTLASRLYASYSWDILTSISESTNWSLEKNSHPFFSDQTEEDTYNYQKSKLEKSLVVLITSNRGLCGGYNSQVIKKAISMLKNETDSNQIDLVVVGKKGDGAMRRLGQNIIATFVDFPDNVTLSDIVPLSTLITNEFKNKNYSKIYITYTDFVSALSQKPNIRKILPIKKEILKETLESIGTKEEKVTINEVKNSYLLEGDINKLLQNLAEKIVQMQIYQMILESIASEQSSRMVAMKNANEAAGEMIDDLTLVFNKARQAGITREISEISAGMVSVE